MENILDFMVIDLFDFNPNSIHKFSYPYVVWKTPANSDVPALACPDVLMPASDGVQVPTSLELPFPDVSDVEVERDNSSTRDPVPDSTGTRQFQPAEKTRPARQKR